MPLLNPAVRAYLRAALDDWKAKRERYISLCLLAQKTDINSEEGKSIHEAVDRALDAWAAAEKRQEDALVAAGIYKAA